MIIACGDTLCEGLGRHNGAALQEYYGDSQAPMLRVGYNVISSFYEEPSMVAQLVVLRCQ